MFPQCKFSRAFLHPRYWLTWFGVGVLWLLVQLPYPVLCFLGTRTGTLARPFLKRRESIARKNLELCFPNLSLRISVHSAWGYLKQVWPGSGRTVECVNGLM